MKNTTCSDCGPSPQGHFEKYLESFIAHLLPNILPRFSFRLERLFEKFLLGARILKKEEFETQKALDSHLWTAFLDEAEKRGMKIWNFRGPFGYINRFELEFTGKRYSFNGLPRAEFLNTTISELVDDKATTKKILADNKMPTPPGRGFNCFQKVKAMEFGLKLGFPLVVKPRSGSMCHHVTLNIQTPEALQDAIARAINYEPFFIVEKYIAGARTFRATVVDNKFVACADRVPANIVGDGVHTIEELAAVKNRVKQLSKEYFPIVLDNTTEQLLKEQGLNSRSIPRAGQKVFLQEKVSLIFGADILDVTSRAHPDNIELFEKISKIFNVKLVGIDFLAQDISRSWRDQIASVVELNSLPHINMHHLPTEGEPVNVGGYICDLVEKYY